MKNILSCSFGKDSMASAILAIEHGEPVNTALYCEVMFSNHTSGEVPEHADFIHAKAIPFLERAGWEVITLRGPKTYTELFSTPVTRGPQSRTIQSLAVVRSLLYTARL